MKKVLSTILLLSFAACGDNIAPASPPTWEDAWGVWAEAVCSYMERCYPKRYLEEEHDDCVVAVTYDNCHQSLYDCNSEFPVEDRSDELAACEADMEALTCGAPFAPESCFRAFE